MSASQTPFIRITVVGLGNSGKTAVINSFVNNYCPTVYEETNDPTLYYKTVRIQSEEEEESQVAMHCVVEIEDTYSSFRGDGRSYGVPRDIKRFLDMTRADETKLALMTSGVSKKSDNRPFAPFQAPKPGQYIPLTKGRMGFMIVFDANDTKSYEEALNLHLLLKEDLERKKIKLEPVVYLVANKIDKDPQSETFFQIIASAELYSKEKMIRLWQVSALEFVNIKKMFREMINMIRSNQTLWLVDSGPAAIMEDALGIDEADGKCTLQ